MTAIGEISALAANRRHRARFELIESWIRQLEAFPTGPITRPQVAATLRVFLEHNEDEVPA